MLEKNSMANYSAKLGQTLYDLKQYGRMWYNCLSEYLTKAGYEK